MRLALSLARRGLGNTFPNPSVGCVLARPDLAHRIVGRGWTRPGGRPHAEAAALEQAGDLAEGATAYVTLEPCSHHGQTPPCADALIQAGVRRVVVAIEDPDERVAGQGVARLRAAGVAVETGLLADEAKRVNRGYLSRRLKGRPYVTLKLAVSADGNIATRSGDSQWITSEGARREGHALRARNDVILTGAGTVIADDPALTCRLPGLEDRSPHRAVMTGGRALPPDCTLLRTADELPLHLYTGSPAPGDVLGDLAVKGYNAVLIEAGARITAAFLEAGLVDEIVCFRAPKIIGGDGLAAIAALGVDRLADAPHFRLIGHREIDGDVIERFLREQQD